MNGRADMTPNPSPDAIAQLNLRYDLAAMAADRYAEAGFDAIVQDVILGKDLADFVKRIASPDRYLVVLSPRVSAQEWREEQRMKTGYVAFLPTLWMRYCKGRQHRSAIGWIPVARPGMRPCRTFSRICNGLRCRAASRLSVLSRLTVGCVRANEDERLSDSRTEREPVP